MKHEVTAKRLREAMEDAGIKAVELSEKSGVSQSSISHYMNGTHIPSNISSGKMAKALGCSPVWLMGFDVPKKNITVLDPPEEKVIPSLEKMDPEEIKKALKMYEQYKGSIPQVQAAVETLLNPKA